MTGTRQRIAAGLALFASVLMLPWWFSALLIVVFAFMFDWYYEAIIAGYLIDSLYGLPLAMLGGLNAGATILSSLAVFLALSIKPRIRFYA